MDTSLINRMIEQRAAASHAVAGALAPKGTSSFAKSTASAAATGTSAASTSATDTSSTITSSDFLTLLVSELKNQDPTQPTDPNQYITQLAQVNSLEQLIQINSGISQLDSSVPTTGSSTTTTPAPGATNPSSGHLQSVSGASPASQIHKQVTGAAAQ